MKKYFKIEPALLVIIIIFYSCKKKTTDTPPPAPKGIFSMHLHTNVDTTGMDSGMIGRDANGRQIQLNLAHFYFSNVTLKAANGITCGLSGIFMKTIGQELYIIGQAPAGNYTGFSFQLGLDNATNQTLPSSYAAGNALTPQTPPMWFGSASQGYIFLNIQGFADTSASKNGPVNQPLNYQLGTSASLIRVNMPARAFAVVSNQTYVAHIIIDYGNLLQNVNFKTQNNVTTFSNSAAASVIVSSIPTMFRYE